MRPSKLIELDAVPSKLDEARRQLQNYRQILQRKYGDDLKLRTYSVVAIGFERLV